MVHLKMKAQNNLRTAPASETLLYLNGLKSSLICTGTLLIGRTPKYGLGETFSVVGLSEDPEGAGLGPPY